jgi:hypothetical protein
MYSGTTGLYSASLRLVKDRLENVEEPIRQFKYTQNTLMGIAKARAAGYETPFNAAERFSALARIASSATSDPENLAGYVWAAGTIGVAIADSHVDRFKEIAREPRRTRGLTAQAVAWMVLASVHGDAAFRPLASGLIDYACARYVHPTSHLVRHLPYGYRRSVGSFAASCYMAYALLTAGRMLGNRKATEVGLQIARKLVRLQGPQGQWAWLYDVPRGAVLDYYPIYSVHQHSMAPFFLLEAVDQGHLTYLDPLIKGFKWLHGQNELSSSMISAEHDVIWRSVERRGNLHRFPTAISAVFGHRGRAAVVNDRRHVRLNRECRSYELGWGLWAYAGRDDLDEILDHTAFDVQRPEQALKK